jgi:ABC-type nitrate/sulfonate/bicarbonate transport system substrate-binding protein
MRNHQTGFGRIGSSLSSILAMLLMASACQNNEPVKMDPISFGTVPVAVAALVYIAQDQQLFAANHLSVDIKDYPTGVATTEALLKAETDISWVAEFPLVKSAFAGEKISIIAVVGKFSEQYLFGRKDRGINTVSDLDDKKIGIPLNTIAEFYLGRFLELNGMSIRDLSLIDVQPPKALDAITGGEVDGAIAWEPYSSQIKAQLGESVVAFPVQSSQPGYGTVVARNDWISRHPDIVNRFLKSLAQAEDYILRNPNGARLILRRRLNHDEAFTETIWSENQFALSLDQSLVLAMEDEARWMISNNLTAEKQVPDFLGYIYEDALKAIKPEAVNIIR